MNEYSILIGGKAGFGIYKSGLAGFREGCDREHRIRKMLGESI